MGAAEVPSPRTERGTRVDNLLKCLGMFDEPELAAARSVRAAWRADEEIWARAALSRWEHERSLVDVLRDCMHRGDTVAIGFPSCTFTGLPTAVGRDVARITTPAGGVDVRIDAAMPAVVRVVRAAKGGGGRGDDTVTTFVARLRQLEGTTVRLGVGAGDEVTGVLGLGRDHLTVVDGEGERAYVPTASVRWVRPDDDD
jgi:hypothetical protein